MDDASSHLSASLKGTKPNIILFNVDDMGVEAKKKPRLYRQTKTLLTGFSDWEWRNPLLETPTMV